VARGVHFRRAEARREQNGPKKSKIPAQRICSIALFADTSMRRSRRLHRAVRDAFVALFVKTAHALVKRSGSRPGNRLGRPQATGLLPVRRFTESLRQVEPPAALGGRICPVSACQLLVSPRDSRANRDGVRFA
jgi:hypothetical protein